MDGFSDLHQSLGHHTSRVLEHTRLFPGAGLHTGLRRAIAVRRDRCNVFRCRRRQEREDNGHEVILSAGDVAAIFSPTGRGHVHSSGRGGHSEQLFLLTGSDSQALFGFEAVRRRCSFWYNHIGDTSNLNGHNNLAKTASIHMPAWTRRAKGELGRARRMGPHLACVF